MAEHCRSLWRYSYNWCMSCLCFPLSHKCLPLLCFFLVPSRREVHKTRLFSPQWEAVFYETIVSKVKLASRISCLISHQTECRMISHIVVIGWKRRLWIRTNNVDEGDISVTWLNIILPCTEEEPGLFFIVYGLKYRPFLVEWLRFVPLVFEA